MCATTTLTSRTCGQKPNEASYAYHERLYILLDASVGMTTAYRPSRATTVLAWYRKAPEGRVNWSVADVMYNGATLCLDYVTIVILSHC